MFIDTTKVIIKAGNGGNGAVSFRHEIYIPKGGPDGGNGGKGGDVVFMASKDENTLLSFRFNPELTAKDGKNGSGQRSAGKFGEDLIVKVPVGTIVRKIDTGEIMADLSVDGEKAIVARGGIGGFGNSHFKSSTRQTPKFAELGVPGEAFEAELELKLLADVGLIGFPNAGKSTFLSVVSNATPEIADYPFTTLVPNLGIATVDKYDILIADIPGLIEGASDGKGLGTAFLRHTERTKVLLHLIDVYSDDAGKSYQIIRRELEKYSPDLATRPEVVALTKTEGLDAELLAMQTASILAINPEAKVLTISSQAHQGLTEVLRALKDEIITANSTAQAAEDFNEAENEEEFNDLENTLPVISLKGAKKSPDSDWSIERYNDRFIVRGAKIENFAIKTNFDNYESVNRLRDILKKMGIRPELTRLGAMPDSVIEIADREFTLIEQ